MMCDNPDCDAACAAIHGPLPRSVEAIPEPSEVDVDGILDGCIKYIGKATRQPDGTWHALADVGGQLALVEAKITFQRPTSPKETT